MIRAFCLTATLATALTAGGSAQSRAQSFGRAADAWCNDGWNRDGASRCEVREETIPGVNPLDIDAGRNGGIRVRGWDRGDVLVRARIVASAETDAEARRLVSAVRVETAGGHIRPDGPESDHNEHWSVSFDIQVPRTAFLTLNTQNGGISIDGFSGSAELHARNGGVSLKNVGGTIHGGTTNGGLDVDLNGDHWDGGGLDVETHNGGVRISMPENYSAELETGTINGRVNIDFPVTVQGTFGRHLTTTLGAGGAKVRAITTNGGVIIRRK
jgi:DUF4097 and DUF4098 domain-containing protein YvlB